MIISGRPIPPQGAPGGVSPPNSSRHMSKPMVHVGNKPILWHIMKTYAHYGYNEFIICLGYKGNMIKEYFLNYEAMNNDFTIVLGNKDSIKFHNNHLEKNSPMATA